MQVAVARISIRKLFLSFGFLISIGLSAGTVFAQELPVVATNFRAGDFKLAFEGNAAAICVDTNEFEVGKIAADCLAADVERVTGLKPKVVSKTEQADSLVFIGTLGRSALIDDLTRNGKLNANLIRAKWESFVIATVPNPAPGVRSGLVIAGSDRRGTAYGVFALSEAIGVSPWYWWADVPSKQQDSLIVRRGTIIQGPPAVKYRGIFINDEDWGMQPWAAKTFEPESKDIGPKTYAKIFELLLRLRANYMWPAMHNCTKAFNLFSENPVAADRYAIVMGSSHCEPMLRNNVGEWPQDQHAAWNYQTNRDAVRSYWEDRVKTNGHYENVYTIGMRGVHDDALPATGTPQQKVKLMEQIFADQRDILARLVNPDPTKVPQAFVPYKEVLKIYRDGLVVPDDVMLIWVDDNHGYIRSLSTPTEQKRKGGSGVYYHVSYWGGPMDYLWLCTTPPALIGEEMGKALDYDARALWVLNVGDLKPAEIDTDYFLRLAWTGKVQTQSQFLTSWAARTFGTKHSAEIVQLLSEYYTLNHAAKPEHLTAVAFMMDPGNDEAAARLARFDRLVKTTDALYAKMPAEFRDAFYELLVYPIRCSALMNEKMLEATRSQKLAAVDDSRANEHADRAEKAYAQIQKETDFYNNELAGGKWRYMMSPNPHNMPDAKMPPVGRVTNGAIRGSGAEAVTAKENTLPKIGEFTEMNGGVSMEASHFTRNVKRHGTEWRVVEGLGRSGNAMTISPTTAPSISDPTKLAANAPCLEYSFKTTNAGPAKLTMYCEPTHHVNIARGLRYAVAIDGESPKIVDIESEENSGTWSANVLRAAALGFTQHQIDRAGPHTLKIWMVDPGVVLDKIVIDLGGVKPAYFGPPETRAAK